MAERTRFEGELEPDEDYEGLRFAEVTFGEAAAGGCHFLDCEFRGVSFGGGLAGRRSRFTGVALREVRFVATDLAESGWQDTTLTGCALAGVQAFSAALRRVVFAGGKLDSVNFRGAVLTDVAFEDCVLRDADFGGATLAAGCSFARAAPWPAADFHEGEPAPRWTCGEPGSASPPGTSRCAASPSTAASSWPWPRTRATGITVADCKGTPCSTTSMTWPWCTPAVTVST